MEAPNVEINPQGDLIETVGNITLNAHYWDCECKEHYIHKKSQMKKCDICGEMEGNMPDSREDGVQEQIYKIR